MKLFCSHHNFFQTRKNSNQRQFTCFLFVSLIDFVFISLFLFVMGIKFEWKTSPKTSQSKTQSDHLCYVFSWKHDESERRVFKIKNDLKKIQYVIQKMENVMNDNKFPRKKVLFRCEFLKGFLSRKSNCWERKTKQINSSLFNSIVHYCECV